MSKKRKYMKPRIEIITMQSERSIMIPVSGTTTPEESQAKKNDIWMEEENGLDSRPTNIWDD
jgi:hypothetical protein